MDKKRIYRVTLALSDLEAVALARLAHHEFRDARTQAHQIIHKNLVSLGLLLDGKIEPVISSGKAIS
jgi:hypothetical protein